MKDENFLIEVHDRFMKTELCNSYIKSAFSGYLLLLDYRKLDPEDFFTLTDSWCFKIKSKNNDSIQLILDFWKYQVNIYVGDEEVQYSDDASVRTEKQQDRFRKALKTLFHSFVVEKKSLNDYKLIFKDPQGITVARFNTKVNFPYLLKNEDVCEKIYKPWLLGNSEIK